MTGPGEFPLSLRSCGKEIACRWETLLAAFFLRDEHAQSAKMKKRNTFNVSFYMHAKNLSIYPRSIAGALQTVSETFQHRHGLLLQSLLSGFLFSGSLTVMSLMELKALGWNTTGFMLGGSTEKRTV